MTIIKDDRRGDGDDFLSSRWYKTGTTASLPLRHMVLLGLQSSVFYMLPLHRISCDGKVTTERSPVGSHGSRSSAGFYVHQRVEGQR